VTFKLTLPVDAPPVITQPYGANPDYYAQWGLAGHEGIDYAAAHGAPVYAATWGTIKLLALDDGTHNYGTHIRITHRDFEDTYETIYAHLHGFVDGLKQGDWVHGSQLIGYADSTGNSTGSHLHFTLKRNGVIVDPTPYFTVEES
jgi:murein DD-endopeptidase MepM/ murein hydrolase activator NlpD